MAFLGQTFDATTVAPSQDYAPLPTGEYVAMIIDSNYKQTNRGDGHYLELTYQITEGPYNGRQVWARLNLDNPSPKASEIAQRDLSAICHAVGKLQVSDSTQLHNIPHVIRVVFEPASSKREREGNEVKGWKRLEGAAAPQPQPFGQQAAANQAKPAGAPAWAKPAA